MPSNLSTISVQNILDFARSHTALRPVLGVGGVSNEPGLSFANDILQYLFARPFAWKFNRKTMNFFMTQPFIQDYLFAGACAFTLNPVVQSGGASTVGGGGVGIDLLSNAAITESANTVTVNCLQPHNFAVGSTVYHNGVTGTSAAAYNAVFTVSTNAMTSIWSNGFAITAIPSPTSYQFTHPTSGLANGGAAGIADFSWMESASITDINNQAVPQPTGPIEALDRLVPTNVCGPTEQVAVMADLGTGVLQLRVMPAGSPYSMAVTPVYQGRAPLLTAPTATWAPWPDRLAFVLRQGMVAFAYRMADKPFAEKEAEWQRFAATAMMALGAMDSEADNQGFAPTVGIMR